MFLLSKKVQLFVYTIITGKKAVFNKSFINKIGVTFPIMDF